MKDALEYLAARLRARGQWRAGPATLSEPAGHDQGCPPGCKASHGQFVPAFHVAWWPVGQGPGYSGGGGNPFVQRGWTARTLFECFERLEEQTRPPQRLIDDLVSEALWLAESDPVELADRRRRYVSSWR